jgi:hypothetical protein
LKKKKDVYVWMDGCKDGTKRERVVLLDGDKTYSHRGCWLGYFLSTFSKYKQRLVNKRDALGPPLNRVPMTVTCCDAIQNRTHTTACLHIE